ncbi:MAG: response regulator, partial [Actinomycetia bacterium]|nr:response regulator [Actinomycetes bacterium]
MKKKKKILIVDDNTQIRKLLKTFLLKEGFDTVTAPNGIKLIGALKFHKPDLILLDIMMSWIDGYDLCKTIKGNKELKDIKVVFVSGKTTRDDIDKGYEVGCDDYITKPFSPRV